MLDKSFKDSTRKGESSAPRPFGEIMILKVEQSKLACEQALRTLLYQLLFMAGVDLLNSALGEKHLEEKDIKELHIKVMFKPL